jgi:hypothetical protein
MGAIGCVRARPGKQPGREALPWRQGHLTTHVRTIYLPVLGFASSGAGRDRSRSRSIVVRGRPVSDTLGEVSNDPPPEREIDVLYVSPDRFHASPQRGLPCRMTFSQLAGYLSRPSVTESKGAAGAWSPALYRDAIRRKAGLIHVEAVVVDVDKGGDVDAAANALSTYRTVVHSTFSSTPDDPRCRIVLALAGAVDIATYNQTHAIVRAHLRARGFLADEAAKDASRVSYSPCVRAGAGFAFRETKGKPIDAAALVAARESDEPRTQQGTPA